MPDIATKRKRKSIAEYLTQHRSPSAIAAGTSFGIILGLIPKDSLLALLLVLAIMFLSVNQIVACGFAIGLTMFSSWTVGLTHAMGSTVLQSELVANVIVSLYQLPIVPWFRLENTVVVGGLVLGGLLWLPTFIIALQFCHRVREIVNTQQVAELAAASLRHRNTKNSERNVEGTSSAFGLIATDEKNIVDAPNETVDAAFAIVAPTRPLGTIATPSDQIGVREQTNFDSLAQKVDSLADDTVLTETLIEVVRYKNPRRERSEKETSITHQSLSNSMKLASPVSTEAVSSTRTSDTNTKFHSPNPTGPMHVPNAPTGKEESLRHILKHIHGSREVKKETGKPA